MRLTAIAVVAAAIAWSPPAIAYPQFQLSLGVERCGACHLSAAGGGLLAELGRDEAGSSVSRGGDGRFLHGAWEPPGWLALGGDVRLAVGDKQVAGRNERLAFPMQLDVQARARAGAVSFHLTAGVRGGARGARDVATPLVERLVSREHYVAYERGAWAARVGRYFPVFGLRLADHTAYVRRFLGFGLLEEPYALELAHLGESTEIRLTAFAPPPIAYLGAGYRASGAAASYERWVADGAARLGAQARLAASEDETRATAGGFATWWMGSPGILWLAELDVQRQTFRAGPGRTQLAAYVGASRWLARGWLATAAAHVWAPDLALRRSRRDALEVDVQYFPLAHVELHLLARVAAQGNAVDDPGALTLLQLHYYL